MLIFVDAMSEKYKYEVIIYWSAADGGTYIEALSNVEVIIDQWIETAKELGRAIPEPKGRLMFA
ncbi:MAG: type II toxin-antitoxin system HicB family antitoxin [Pyrinomonadaceae bacterium]